MPSKSPFGKPHWSFNLETRARESAAQSLLVDLAGVQDTTAATYGSLNGVQNSWVSSKVPSCYSVGWVFLVLLSLVTLGGQLSHNLHLSSAIQFFSAESNSQTAQRRWTLAAGSPADEMIHVAIVCAEAAQHRPVHMAIRNIVSVSRGPFTFHILSEGIDGAPPIEVSEHWSPLGASVRAYDLGDVSLKVKGIHAQLASYATDQEKMLLYKALLHMILPASVDRVLVWSPDLFAVRDIRALWTEFGSFSSAEIFGMVPEQTSAYFRWWSHDQADDYQGFNDGMMLVDLARLRHYVPYEEDLATLFPTWLSNKPPASSSRSLGDEDFFSLLGHAHRELFHPLACGWNRQLCEPPLAVHALQSCSWPSVHVLRGSCDEPFAAPCSPTCPESLSASGLVTRLLHEPCGSDGVQASLARLSLATPRFNCSA